MVFGDPFVKASKFLPTSTVLAEITSRELAPCVNRQPGTKAAGRGKELLHDVHVDLGRGRDDHHVVTLVLMPLQTSEYPVTAVTLKVRDGKDARCGDDLGEVFTQQELAKEPLLRLISPVSTAQGSYEEWAAQGEARNVGGAVTP
jgi:hypothetical protein